jgi:hypothetical protein
MISKMAIGLGLCTLVTIAASEAQSTAEVVMGVTALRVNSERAKQLITATPSPSVPELLSALMEDRSTEVDRQIERLLPAGASSRIRVGDHITLVILPRVQVAARTVQVHSSTEVTLHVEITVSAVSQYVSLGGLSQPMIVGNKNIADLRVRDGEASILGGLDEIRDSLSANGIPGLVNIPALGNVLFGSKNTEKDKTQLLIALIPHIVRTPD